MTCDSDRGRELDAPLAEDGTVLLIGNPNVGKSALFGRLTGAYVTVSNYPGTTVEVSRARMEIAGRVCEVVDTPGTASLVARAEDEAVTRDIVVGNPAARALLTADAKNLERALGLALELAELELPFVLALNMADEAQASGLAVDAGALARRLGVPAIETVAVRGEGLDGLRAALGQARPATWRCPYPAEVEQALTAIGERLVLPAAGRRGRAALLLCGDAGPLESVEPAAAAEAARLRAVRPGLRRALLEARAEAAATVAAEVLAADRPAAGPWPTRLLGGLGRAALHPVGGPLVLLGVLYACYLLVGRLGAGVLVDLLERRLFGELLVPAADRGFRALLPGGSVRDFLIGERIDGAGILLGRHGLLSMGLSYGVAIVLPIVATFFLAFAVLEDSGYLPRLAVVANRAMRLLGLNGKAVLPMVLGLGCDTMATLSARILDSRRERLLVTLLLALAVPCSAQLGVILGMLSGVAPGLALFWVGAVAVSTILVGRLAARLLPGETSDFVLEVPPMRLPRPANLLVKTVARVEWYLREAVPLFLAGTLLLWGLDRAGALPVVERLLEPVVVGWLGLPPRASEALVVGFLRRDFGAAGLYALYADGLAAGSLGRDGQIQVVVAMVVITLFMPCIANFLVIVKERGMRAALAIAGFVFPFAFAAGAGVNFLMRRLLG